MSRGRVGELLGAMTEDEVFHLLHDDPRNAALIQGLYWDHDVLAAAERFRMSEEYFAVCHVLRKCLPRRPLRILELGAGRGGAAYAFARDGHEVAVAEPCASVCLGRGAIVDLMERTGVRIRLLAAAGEGIPFRSNSWDLVYARQVLHHARDLEQMLRECFLALRPRGYLLATREHVLTRREDLQAFLSGHPTHRYLLNEDAHTLDVYLNGFTGAGFRIKRVWAPVESVINFYPGTEAERDTLVRQIPKLAWRGLGRMFSSTAAFRRYAVRRFIRRDQTPGRMYSFLAERP